MADYTFVDGPDNASLGPDDAAYVYNLDFFNTDDTVTGTGNSGLFFDIGGDLALDLTGYAGITGFPHIIARATGSIDLTIGQDYFAANSLDNTLEIFVQALGGPETVDASGTSGTVVFGSYGTSYAVLTGGAGNDFISGGAGDDQLNGGAGDDQIIGDTIGPTDNGDDVLVGGAGADTLIGADGIDVASYIGSALAVTVDLSLGTGHGGDAEGDTLQTIEGVTGSTRDDRLLGDAGANALDGGAGDDFLRGGAGADALTGGGGGDALKGGAGSDRFVYTALSDSAVSGSGKDTITDFAAGDRIDLSAIDADGNPANGNTAFSFGTGGFIGHAGELRVVTAGALQVVYADINGDKAPDFAINVISDHALTAADFVL